MSEALFNEFMSQSARMLSAQLRDVLDIIVSYKQRFPGILDQKSLADVTSVIYLDARDYIESRADAAYAYTKDPAEYFQYMDDAFRRHVEVLVARRFAPALATAASKKHLRDPRPPRLEKRRGVSV